MNKVVPTLDYTKDNYQNELANVLNWLGKMLNQNELKRELVQYSKTVDREEQATLISSNKIMLAGKLAYCINRGAKLEERSIDKIHTLLDLVDVNESSNTDVEDDARLSPKIKSIISYVSCYSLIDQAWYSYVRESKDFKNLSDEVRAIIRKNSNGKTPILKELFGHYQTVFEEAKSDTTVKTWLKPLSIVYSTIELMLTTTAASKRSKRRNNGIVDKKADRAATNLTYLAEDNSLGIKSILPQSVIGAKAVVLYNTRNKHCEVYYSEGDQTLSLKGAYITNFDAAKSASKTLRKPQENLVHWGQASSVRRLEVLFDNTSGKSQPVKGKFNKNIVILKAIH